MPQIVELATRLLFSCSLLPAAKLFIGQWIIIGLHAKFLK